MKARFIKFKRLHPLAIFKHTFSKASLDNERKRKIFGRNPLKLGMKANSILAIGIIVIILVSVFGFLPKGNNSSPNTPPQSTDAPIANGTAPPATSHPTSKPDPVSQLSGWIGSIGNSIVTALTPPRAPGTIEAAGGMNSSVWRQVARNAWNYFQPDVGINSATGLPGSGYGVPIFTDWDLGVYIQAVMDANATGLIGYDGAWGSSARLEKVVHFLETRELNNASYPYWFYQSDGYDYHANSDFASSPVDIVDTGRLFVALNNLRAFNSSLAPRIDNLVYNTYNNRSDYAALVPAIKLDSQSSTSIYAYYVYSGFASFWPNQLSNATNTILNNMRSAGNVTTPEGVSLPLAAILGDPLLCSVFELNNNNSQLMTITRQVYLAHEAYYNATGQYRAFSEGASLSTHWTYEWIVLPDGRTWVILDEKAQPFNISPIIYTKIAIGFLAIYNTTYAYNMVVYLEKTLPDPVNGYSEGVDESGNQLTGVGSNTNGMIIGAAKYAIQNNP